PTVQHALHTSQAGVSWVLIAWLLSASVATPIIGRVGDMIGKEKTLLVILGAIAAGSLVAALAPNIGVMVAGRVIQGLGGAVYPVSFGIIRDEFDRRRGAAAKRGPFDGAPLGGVSRTHHRAPPTAAVRWSGRLPHPARI